MPAGHHVKAQQKEELPLSKAAQMLLEECRMVLPGIQALFGFQLVAVFNSAFDQKLSQTEQHLHFTALALVAIAVALVMAPAAFHRQAGITEITDTFLKLSTRLMLWSMWPLTLGVCIDFYIVARVLIGGALAPWVATALFSIYVGLWFVLPRTLKRFASP
ncbi:MAG TPA: DUF6328 family protein [Nevskiaceae bacterium]|nr:DUF6328 family protein [Nevskiaceae bacterium]